MRYICTLITVADIDRSRRIYEEVLGLTPDMDHGENVSYKEGLALHKRSHFETLITPETVTGRNHSFEVYFEHDDLEDMENRIRKEGLEFNHPIQEQPWRQRVMRFYDYDGNLIEVGESMEHLALRLRDEGWSVEKIGMTTGLNSVWLKEALEQ